MHEHDGKTTTVGPWASSSVAFVSYVPVMDAAPPRAGVARFTVPADEARDVARLLGRRMAYVDAHGDGRAVLVWDFVAGLERYAAVEALKLARSLLSPEDVARVEARYREALGR